MLWSGHQEYVSNVIQGYSNLSNRIEVETRIGYWTVDGEGKERFHSSVRYAHYKKLTEALKSFPGVTSETKQIVSTSYEKGYRKRVVNSQVEWERKLNIHGP